MLDYDLQSLSCSNLDSNSRTDSRRSVLGRSFTKKKKWQNVAGNYLMTKRKCLQQEQ